MIQPTKLSIIRKSKNLSQSQLANLSGVNLRTLQYYEQRVKDINKAQVFTVYKLAKALDCKIEDLVEE